MELGLADRAALVGGASSGLGRAIAFRLAAEGCRLVLWSRGGEALDRTAEELRRTHVVEVATVKGDAADPTTASRIATEAQGAFGRIDIAILNQGGPPSGPADQTDPAEWRRAFQLLAVTPIELATLLLPGMRERHWGRIVSVLSYGIRTPIANLSYSNACRSALMAWLKTIAPDVAPDGVTVNGVLPGLFATARVASLDQGAAERTGKSVDEVRNQNFRNIPMGRYGDPDEFAAYVAWLCSESARFQTGTFVSIDGGMNRTLP